MLPGQCDVRLIKKQVLGMPSSGVKVIEPECAKKRLLVSVKKEK